MDRAKVIAAAVRPYLRRKGDDAFVAEQVLRGLAAAGYTIVRPVTVEEEAANHW